MGLIMYVCLLLVTPKILSLPFDPQDSAFLSWAHSYAAFHNHCIPQSTTGSFHNPLLGLWSTPLFISGRLPMVGITTSRKGLSPNL